MYFRPIVIAVCTFFVSITKTIGEKNGPKVTEVDANATLPQSSGGICTTPECIHAASMILSSMNPNVEPCDDFYEFACGNYDNSAVIPDSDAWTASLSKGPEEVQWRVHQIIENIDESKAPKPFAKIKILYKNCMNDVSEWKDNTVDFETWRRETLKIGGWPVLMRGGWDDSFFDNSLAFPYMFEFDDEINVRNISQAVLQLTIQKPVIAWSFFKEKSWNDALRAYHDFMVNIALYLGADKWQATADLGEVISMEIELYEIIFPNKEDRGLYENFTLTTIGELNRKYPSISFKTLAKKDDDDCVVQTSVSADIIDRLEKWILAKPKRSLANWLIWRYTSRRLYSYGGYIAHRTKIFNDFLVGVQVKDANKSKKCFETLQPIFQFFLNLLYQGQYLSESVVNDTRELFSNIKQQFVGLVEKTQWLGDSTKQHALKKITNMRSSFGACRKFLLDDNSDEFQHDQIFFDTSIANNRINVNELMAALRSNKPINEGLHSEPVECSEFLQSNGFYTILYNHLTIGPGLLTEFYYDIRRPKALNYGALGMLIAHETAHSLDIVGRNYDENGKPNPWWDFESNKKYVERAQCFLDQYKNYKIDESGQQLNNIASGPEDLSDNVGAKLAYLAYDDWAKKHEPEHQLPGLNYSPRQLFWISMANSWCAKYRPKFLRNLIYIDEHSPHKIRINGALSNMPEFSKDFKCSATSKMNPVKKCSLW